jgi:glycosyltransferase involved in cell wall biosynthesis
LTSVLFDASRLIVRASRPLPTGIDRVTEAYGRWLLARPDLSVTPVCTFGGIPVPISRGLFDRLLQPRPRPENQAEAEWRRLSAALASPQDHPVALRSTPERGPFIPGWGRYAPTALHILANARPRPLPPGGLFINVSHFGLEQPGLLPRLAARGVKPVIMIHDLIPIVHPEFCGKFAAEWHRRRIEAVLADAGLIIANSASTAHEINAYAHDRGLRAPPITVAPLGLEETFLETPQRPESQASLPSGPYFVCIGTLEPRKNLAFLLAVWGRLAERLGAATPPLVLAGRRGWENEAVIDQLERARVVVRLVHETDSLGDTHLLRLISGATALLAPSFSEGFNLPVAEALAVGTPVIASDIPVHRELAGEAQLIDPLDGPAWLNAIEAIMREPPARTPRPMLGWAQHFAIVEKALGIEA